MIQNIIVGLLRRRRIVAGVTQQQVADKVGVHLIHLQRIERGAQAMTLSEYYRVLNALGLSESDILCDLFDQQCILTFRDETPNNLAYRTW
ncbi:helix-turn-helix domain-containing protein [Vibrio profundum]|uniref:helix-turn-helix domain-containing protein n=1 Tax=Vibrio profundum TaxID=2910247 RepID=UPI003D1324A4